MQDILRHIPLKNIYLGNSRDRSLSEVPPNITLGITYMSWSNFLASIAYFKSYSNPFLGDIQVIFYILNYFENLTVDGIGLIDSGSNAHLLWGFNLETP